MSQYNRRKFLKQVGQGAIISGAGVLSFGLLESEAIAVKTLFVFVRGTDPKKMILSAMKVFRGMSKFVKGKKVVLKPNMSFKNPATWANNTNPLVAQAVAQICLDSGASLITAVDHTMGQGGRSIKACGIGPALEKVKGVKVFSAHKKSDYTR